MSSSFTKKECRKFTPNIFNNSKCTNCFHQKEEHTAEALECNRTTRKVSKCGYMFVAPGWDFSDPINRTKRWQRRWFVLYDDGELSYSLDEHPDTVPQASIDMNKVMEVTEADEVTGNPYSLAITAPDAVHFVKGTCREEAKWWKDVLSVLPRNKGRHKRNATFPGSQTSTIVQPATFSCRSSPNGRSRFRKLTDSGILIPASSSKWLNTEDKMHPTKDITLSVESSDSTLSEGKKLDYLSDSGSIEGKSFSNFHPASSFSPPTRDKVNSDVVMKTRRPLLGEKSNLKFEKEFFGDQDKTDSNFEGDVTALKNMNQDIKNSMIDDLLSKNDVARRLIFESENTKREEKLKDIADSLTNPRLRKHASKEILSSCEHRSLNQIKPTRDGECSDEEKVLDSRSPEPPVVKNDIIRGDPDGCGLDLTLHRYSCNSELRVDLPAEDLLNIKKGWLFKQDNERQDWTKHWFVLRGVALMYYRDPAAEDKGILDGVMDLSSVNNVMEVQVPRNYGFQAISWDDKKYVLSAATAGIRNNWMTAIRKAAGLVKPFTAVSLNRNEKSRRDPDKCQRKAKTSQYFEPSHSSSRIHYLESDSGPQKLGNGQFLKSSCLSIAQFDGSSSLPINGSRSPGCHFVEHYLKGPSNGQFSKHDRVNRSPQSLFPNFYDVQSEEDFKGLKSKENDEWKKEHAPLPPSPPLNRTPISKVKERAKTQTTKSRVFNKRSKSSPPSSRRNTLDISHVEENVWVCEDKIEEPNKRSTAADKVHIPVKEIDGLKDQLNMTLSERPSAEKELTRLRQKKSEANYQVEKLLQSLKMAEEELKSKALELENFETLKQRYSALVSEHEEMLKLWRENAVNSNWRELCPRLKKENASDRDSWELKLVDVTSMLHVVTERCEMLAGELASSEGTIEALKAELTTLSERLMRGLEENEGLYSRLRELEGRCLSSSRERGRSVDSLSDLTNIDLDIDLENLDKERIIEEYEELKGRFEKAIQEIRAMKKELRESHTHYDELELTVINLRQDSKRREENGKAQAALMASRIEDLTLKLSASEKQSRLLKQKIAKSESKEKRRSLSLKGKESFHMAKETEEKLAELEAKINALESGNSVSSVVPKTSTSPLPKENIGEPKLSRLRRKSLESAACTEPMKVLVRMFSLEQRIAKASKNIIDRSSVGQTNDKESENEENKLLPKIVNKLEECKSILSSLKTGNLVSLPKTHTLLENCLAEAENLLMQDSLVKKSSNKENIFLTGIYGNSVVHNLENLLKTKMTELWKKRQKLLEKKELNEEIKLKLIAEKLAYESVLIKKIRETIEESLLNSEGRNWKNSIDITELLEINALIELVTRKVKGENICAIGNGLDGLSKILAETLYLEGKIMDLNSTADIKMLFKTKDSYIDCDKILYQQKSLLDLVTTYRNQKLQDIAGILALESLFFSDEIEKGKKFDLKEDKRLREAWSVAQEALNKEFVQMEISHIAMRCLLMCESSKTKEVSGMLTFIAEKYKRQEDCFRTVEESIKEVMDQCIGELNREYEKTLKNMKTESWVKNSESLKEENKKCKQAMEDLFGVLAQVTIINAKIGSLTEISQKTEDTSNRPIVRGVRLKSHFPDLDLETRFIYLYQKFSMECLQATEQAEFHSKDSKDSGEIIKALNISLESVKRLREIFRLSGFVVKDQPKSIDGSTIWEKSNCLATELEDIVNRAQGELFCRQCSLLTEALKNVKCQHNAEISALKARHEKEIKDLQGELEFQKTSLLCQHEQEQAQLIERTRLLERRLGTLDAEYSQQISNLRTAYHRTISADLYDKDENTEESIRQRYQAEIEQLRTLCEKGLSAVDNSHRRIIAELEEKHRQELAAAAAEKEQALAEETQATLAALDAMRKAHETEVQKEINKFKTEFLKKMQSNHGIAGLHKEQEIEMEEIKKEILSLSEKYSVKCVESASLEEQLSHVNKQLSQAQEHIMQLDARNKKLRAHIVSGTLDFEDLDRFSTDEIDAGFQNRLLSLQKTAAPAHSPTIGRNRGSSRQLVETLKNL